MQQSLIVYGGYNTVKGGLWRGLGGILLHIHPLDLVSGINEMDLPYHHTYLKARYPSGSAFCILCLSRGSHEVL